MKIKDLFFAPSPVDTDVQQYHSDTLKNLVVSSQLQSFGGFGVSKALGVAAIFRARQMNADTISGLPVKAGDSLVPAPNEDQDTQDFVSDTVLSMQDVGDAYWDLDARGNLRVLNPSGMHVDWSDPGTQSGRRLYTWNGNSRRTTGFGRNLVVVSVNRGPSDLTGRGPMQSARIRGLIAEQEYSQEYFENNAQHTGALVHPGVLDATEAQALYDQWMMGQRERTTGVLSGGLDYKPLSFNPSDSEWVETHAAGVLDAATLFGIPAFLLNTAVAGSSLTYQSTGSVYEGYWRSTLAPTYARRIESAWSQVLGTTVRFDPEELFLASLKERAEAAATLIRSGFRPEGSLDTVGLPPVEHTGILPVSVEQEGGPV